MKEKKTWYKRMGKALLLLSLITVLGMPSSVLAGGSTTLSVRSGQNITAQLKKAVKKYNTIRIPGGTYQISGNIALDNKTVIQPKSGKVVLQQTRSGKSIFTANGAKRLTIKGITLDVHCFLLSVHPAFLFPMCVSSTVASRVSIWTGGQPLLVTAVLSTMQVQHCMLPAPVSLS